MLAASFLHSSFLQTINAVIRCLLCLPVYFPVHFHDKSMCSRRLRGCVLAEAAHYLQQVHRVCENDGMRNMCVTLGGYSHFMRM